VIALVIGHSDDAPGATTPEGHLSEYAIFRRFVPRLQERCTADTVVFRRTDGLADLVRRINDAAPSHVISFHANAFNCQISGSEALYYPGSTDGKALAQAMLDATTRVLGLDNRGLKPRADLPILRDTAAPACLVEPFFIDAAYDVFRFATRAGDLVRSYAQAIDTLSVEVPMG